MIPAVGYIRRRFQALFYSPHDSRVQHFIKKYCVGKGIEIGPGSYPLVKGPNVMYLDKFQPKVKGRRLTLISEAWQIPVREDAYDFLVSSHTLEHCPDTLRTLYEWKRVLRHEGVLFLVLPHGERTFDKGRQLTTLSHHIEDWEKQVGYDDSTHWMEFEKYSIPQYEHHWLSEARQGDGSIDFEYVVRNGHMHYHVWTQMEIVDVLKYIGCKIMVVDEELQGRRDSFLVIGSVGKK